MILITDDRNSKFAKKVYNDFPKVTIVETSNKNICSILSQKDNVYIDKNSKSEKLNSIKLFLEVNVIEYKTIIETPTGYEYQ